MATTAVPSAPYEQPALFAHTVGHRRRKRLLDANNTTILPLIASYGSTFTTNFQIIYTGVFV